MREIDDTGAVQSVVSRPRPFSATAPTAPAAAAAPSAAGGASVVLRGTTSD
ncbi:MAG UNVERIFIED_CONTAM: hypothetical protein LVR18_39705 [Planctomycetaceae bacterium]